MIKLIIFDFDGVLVDTQEIVNELERQCLEPYGILMPLEEFTKRFSGETVQSIIERLKEEDSIEFLQEAQATAQEIDESVFKKLLQMKIDPIAGVQDVLSHLTLKKCVASNCPLRILKTLLRASALDAYFGDKIFGADEVEKPKPYPDLFLYAARKLGENPSSALVVEDSEVGVKAAVRAGMRVVGFLGGGHTRPADKEKLTKAGAEQVFTKMRQLQNFLMRLQENKEGRINDTNRF